MAMDSQHNITVGKYLISPLTKLLANGWYACSVSIRSGTGSATHDRVLRLTRLFRTQMAAVAFATTEGLQWIGHGGRANPVASVVSH
jgi:phage gp46-like protein